MTTAPTTSEASHGFDNNGQYSNRSILRYEKIFGPGYISTGGHETTEYLCSKLGPALKPGVRVLDVGSGIGGAAFFLARAYGAVVTGIDLAEEMDAIARERAQGTGTSGSVRFILGNVLEEPRGETFDIIWSRDALMHVPDKPALFARLYELTAPNGELVITDYACGAKALSPEFQTYARDTGYHLTDPAAYGKLLEQAGYSDVVVEDATDRFVDILEREAQRLSEHRAEFLKVFGEEDLNYLVDRWKRKVGFCGAGDMKWGIYRASRRGA